MSPHAILLHYGYLGVVLALIMEFLLIPFPAETILVIAGFMWHQGIFHIVPLLIVASLGSWTGSLCAYWLGRTLGRPLLLRFGRYVRLDEHKLVRTERAFERYSIAILGIGRFIAFMRVLIAYVAGINRMNSSLYMLITLCSAALWASTFVLLGATIGIEWHRLAGWIAANPALSVLIGAAAAAAIAWLWMRRRKRDKARRELDADAP